MKKELLILLVIVSSAMILSAEGKQDDTDTQIYGRGPGQGMMRDFDNRVLDRDEFREERQAEMDEYLEGLETISLTGPLMLVNGELPSIDSDGTKFTIMAPWYDLENLELKNGMVVTVEGYEMPGPPMQWDDSVKSIMVIKAVINGKEFEVDHNAYGSGFGMMGGPGRKGGMMGRRF
ncbi:MAG: hypothetical protein PF518_12215 [Spirochaetaceae bacterium]|nr:hypothetical protein [Spirochaetaceae bacterium]